MSIMQPLNDAILKVLQEAVEQENGNCYIIHKSFFDELEKQYENFFVEEDENGNNA